MKERGNTDMKRTLLSALFLAMSLMAGLQAKADWAYYDDEPVVTRQRVVTERRYIEETPTYRREVVRVYRGVPVEEERRVVVYREEERPRYILPPGPHRIVQHILFGDPIE